MKKSDQATNILFLSFLFFFLIAHLIMPDQSFSEQENRTLSTFPSLKAEEVLSGKTARQIEEYIQDQFPWRAQFVAGRTALELLQGKRLISGVYVIKDQLIQQLNTLDEKRYAANLRLINEFAAAISLPVDVLVIPSAAFINEEILPENHPDIDQELLLQRIGEDLVNCTLIDVTDALKEADINPFYRTDHHLNAYGSWLTYKAYRSALALPVTDFEYEIAADSFKGTLSSKSGTFWIEGDPILTPMSSSITKVQVVYYDGNTTKTADSVFNEDNLNIKDKYTYYLDGNHPLVEIITEHTDKPELLVLTDSYGHSLAPFLIQDYSKIRFVDLRYYHLPVSELLDKTERVLIYYGIESFISDANFAWLK